MSSIIRQYTKRSTPERWVGSAINGGKSLQDAGEIFQEKICDEIYELLAKQIHTVSPED